jgi:tripartite-type tricarboxylate transporter receptor subunit TctC
MVFKGITRRLAAGQVGAACFCLAARVSHASAFPSRPVRVLVGAAPGGPSDFMARLFSDAATAALGQSFVVENLAGASGILAAAEAARAEPDGHTVRPGPTAR